VLVRIAEQRVVPIIGLNWKDDRDTARRFLVESGNPYAVVAEDAEGRVAIDWGVYGAPETFLVGSDGVVLFKHVAPMTLDVWEKEFVPRLAAARDAGATR
jgi:cytochrome c biogenesis protein CcmG/thiol:disulfide interchange protein DsbE